MKKYRYKIKDYVVFEIGGKVVKCYSKEWKEYLWSKGYKMSLSYK